MDSQQLIIQNALTKLTYQVDAALLTAQEKSLVMQKFHGVDTRFLEHLCGQAQRRLTATNLAYIICFAAGLETQTIATIFTVTPATVYSVRYRLRACFKQGTILPF